MSKRTRTFSLETTGGLSVVRPCLSDVRLFVSSTFSRFNESPPTSCADADVNLVSYVQWPGKPSQLLLISSTVLGRTDCAV